MFTTAFLLATLERAVKTFAQSLAALLVADGTDLITTDWGGRLAVAGMASVVSVLTSVASGVTGSGPSLGTETLTADVAAVEQPSEDRLVAGPAADVPEGEPVEVISEGVADFGAGASDAAGRIGEKAAATYHGDDYQGRH